MALLSPTEMSLISLFNPPGGFGVDLKFTVPPRAMVIPEGEFVEWEEEYESLSGVVRNEARGV